MAYGGGQFKRERPLDDPNNGYDLPPQKRMPVAGAYAGGITPLSEARPYGAEPRSYGAEARPYGGDRGYASEPRYGGPEGYGRERPPQQRSPSREFQREPAMRAPHQSVDDLASNVLLITVFNPKYPITVDVMHTICSADNRRVNRIMIFRKNGVQAMVEFDSVDSAERAKESLNGADIYSGCCTLKIEWAKPARLAVTRNDTDSWDYTNPNLGKEPPKSAPLLPNPPKFGGGGGGGGPMGEPYGRHPDEFAEPDLPPLPRRGGPGPMPLMRDVGEYGYEERGFRGSPQDPEPFDPYRRGGPPPPMERERYGPPPIPSLVPRTRLPPQEPYRDDPYGPPPGAPRGGMPPRGGGMPPRGGAAPPQRGGPAPRGGGPPRGGGRGGYRGGLPPPLGGEQYRGEGGAVGQMSLEQHEGCVLMVYGIPEMKINCQKLFNLFCLYGNVIKVRFLKSKEENAVAMIQLGNEESCERAINGLNGAMMFGGKLALSPSKKAFIENPQHPQTLPDGTPSFSDFTTSRNNRFATAEAAAKNRVLPVTKSLYFFNAPSNITEDDIVKIFLDVEAKAPTKIKIFPSRNDKSCTGMLEWEDKTDCAEALALANHSVLRSPAASKHPFVIKFSFSGQPRDH